MSNESRVTIEISDHVAQVRLNRPEKHNGMDLAMLDAVIDAGKTLRKNRALRAVIISGNGPSFCAGLDVSSVMGNKAKALSLVAELYKPWTNRVQRWGTIWRALPVPVIACIHGNCFGAGIQLALAADMRIAHTEARLSVMEAKWGLVPDMSGLLTLRELLPADRIKELVFSGRIVTATEAQQIGLVTDVATDPQAKADELVNAFKQRSPDAIAAGKALIHEALAGNGLTALVGERKWQRRIIGRENQRIAVKRNTEIAQDGRPKTPFKPRRR